MTQRLDKVNPFILQTLAEIIQKEVEFPNSCLVTLTRTKTSPDLKYCQIFISVLPELYRGTALKILRLNQARLKKALNRNLKSKFTPNLQFLIDEQAVYASEIDQLLDEVAKS